MGFSNNSLAFNVEFVSHKCLIHTHTAQLDSSINVLFTPLFKFDFMHRIKVQGATACAWDVVTKTGTTSAVGDG